MKSFESILRTLAANGEYVSIHSNASDTGAFAFGRVAGTDSSFFAISAVSPDGKKDGLLIKDISAIQYIEQSSKYHEKMLRLIQHSGEQQEPVDSAWFSSNHILKDSIVYAQKEHCIVSIEINHSGTMDITGFLTELDGEMCTIHQINEYGEPDGTCYVHTDSITQLSMLSREEKRIEVLYQENRV